MLEYLSATACLLAALEKNITMYLVLLTLRYLAPSSCLQVLTAAKIVLWNSYLEATADEKELVWARIANIFGVNNSMVTL